MLKVFFSTSFLGLSLVNWEQGYPVTFFFTGASPFLCCPQTQSNLSTSQFWPKVLGRFLNFNMKSPPPLPFPPPPAPKKCCHVAVFFGYQYCLGEGAGDFKNFAMTAPPSLWQLVIDSQNTNVHCQCYLGICPRKYWPGLWSKERLGRECGIALSQSISH